ncbi:Flavin-dependent oxidoreductase, luciferase family (includes alkanesulfonate monooxygenase SsuD and methylene tetrahydromethanopterin reductase) [Mycobacterium numidiamassiliense]|uniref:Flavin-dependent oxidoreductase, luciferase family (Includes alkanesulfonate monooxygenase SsuD and methylene tetrahydromethanopterin reductase) n=1 Tax=Mycobacterium numidiamassiliense TaxID=1841861 RepID=A0A2U3P886_9MYCO|nr:TIGR03621 family F420-dependent LLM class oxidoreductase [Mycobacterium numidiamassiliense]SPM39885.1 Flavin-dependent oxidoreductase, luciferase family (includes alkanesulfonate monooxygenase SsuD and methylene tetrahydromethanopterin reductase) [Mycobacterium numidiamassiliense]
MDRPPFRFAVQATNAAGGRQWRDTVRKVEDLGYTTLFLADHYLGPGPAQRAARTPRQDLAPIAAMAAAAAVTETLRVGCRVFCIDYHVPAVLAKEAATLDLLSDGRLELGIGAGWSGVEYDALGVEFDRPGRRIAKLAEVVALIKAHWQGDELNYAGDFVRVHGYAGRPRPVQQPHPPIMIGGGGQRVLSLAGREADIVSISSVPFVARDADGLDPQAVAQRRIEYVRAAAGERYGGLDVESSPYFTAITDDPETVLAELAKSTGLEADLLRDHPNVLIGSSESVVEQLHSSRETLGVNYVTVQQTQIESFAPVVALLHGQ